MQGRQGLVLEEDKENIWHERTATLRLTTANLLLFKHRPCTSHCRFPILVTLLQIWGLLLQNTPPQAWLSSVLYLEVLYIHAEDLLNLDSDISSLHEYMWLYEIRDAQAAMVQGLHRMIRFTDEVWNQLITNSQVGSPCSVHGERNSSKRGWGSNAPPSKAKTHRSLLCSARSKLKKWSAVIRASTEVNSEAPGDISDAGWKT